MRVGECNKGPWYHDLVPTLKKATSESPMILLTRGLRTCVLCIWSLANYYRAQLGYLIVVSLLGGVVIYIAEVASGHDGYSYVDYWFLSSSSVSQTGINTNDLTVMSIEGLVIQVFLTILGSLGRDPVLSMLLIHLPIIVLLSVVPVLIRIYYFSKQKNLLKESEKARLEYQGLWRIAAIVVGYFLVIHFGEWFVLGLYVSLNPSANDVLAKNGVAPAWWTFFHVENSFANTGFSLFPDNYIQWATYPFILLNNMFISQCGDVAFPINMYLIVWALQKIFFFNPEEQKVYTYMMTYPRRLFCYLFPWRETVWLTITLVALYLVPAIIFIGVEWDKGTLVGLSGRDKVMNSFHQVVATRHGGYNSVDLREVQPVTWVIFLGLLYVSTSPLTVVIRVTNPNEEAIVERDYSGAHHVIGVRKKKESADNSTGGSIQYEKTEGFTLKYQIMSVFTSHAVFIFVCFAIISGVEGDQVIKDPENYSLANILFEVLSCYGTTGLSWGLPNSNSVALCGGFHTVSKLVLICVMMLGRMRGVPQSVDKAVQLPDINDIQFYTTTTSPSNKEEDEGEEVAYGDREMHEVGSLPGEEEEEDPLGEDTRGS